MLDKNEYAQTNYVTTMKKKESRLHAIIELIHNNWIGSQDELAKMLAEKGFSVTQATLSRDLKKLKITKVGTDTGSYIYILADSNDLHDKILAKAPGSLRKGSLDRFISINFSGPVAVIKTRNGYASGLAYDIDMSKSPYILGTIAGADTLFAIMKEGLSREEALQVFSAYLPINEKGEIEEIEDNI